MNGPRPISHARSIAPAVLAVLTAIGASRTETPPGVTVWLAVIVLGASGVTAWRVAAAGPTIIGLTVVAAGVTVACYGDPRNLGWFGLCVVAGWVALEMPRPIAVLAGMGMAAVFVVQLVTVSAEPGWFTWIAGIAFTTGACIFARRQRILVERLHRAQAELTQRARDDERHRIAREMHDLVGHRLTVAVLHVGSARLALDDDLGSARSSLAAAEQAARDGLDDVRAALGLLRGAGSPTGFPAPASADVGDLVESYRNAGARIELDQRGDLDALSPNRSLAAFRIVQESLTNAVRHGDGRPIEVRIHVVAGRVRIVVRNTTRGRPTRRSGTGIVAMGERAGAVGGHLAAGPGPDGWLVEAVIPA